MAAKGLSTPDTTAKAILAGDGEISAVEAMRSPDFGKTNIEAGLRVMCLATLEIADRLPEKPMK